MSAPLPATNVPQPHQRRGRLDMIRYSEGQRGQATRTALYLRYASYLLVTLLGAGIAQACLARQEGWSSAGLMLLGSVSFQFATAALGTITSPLHRAEIIKSVRHFAFGMCLMPAVGTAVFIAGVRALSDGSSSNGDVFVTMMHRYVPWLYAATVLLPALVFVKNVAGLRTLHRARLDDEELLALYARQDGLQR